MGIGRVGSGAEAAITYEQVAFVDPITGLALSELDVAQGWRDDNTESGVQRVELVRGALVCIPIRAGLYTEATAGSVSAATPNTRFVDNDDGTQTGFNIVIPGSATLANAMTIGFWFLGDIFGLRLQRDATYGGNPMGCLIDGASYDVDTSILLNPVVETTTLTQPGLDWQILATDLGAGPHYVELTFPCGLSVTRNYGIHGYIVDTRAGYTPLRRGSKFDIAPTSLTASSVSSLPIFSSHKCYGFRSIILYNPTAGVAIVKIKYTAGATYQWGKSIAAGDSVIFDPGDIIYHAVDILSDTTGVIATAVDAM
jgi:hypothetical protein